MQYRTEKLVREKITALAILCLLLICCNLVQAQTGNSNQSVSLLGEDYMIGPGDVLDIKIFDSEDLDRKVRVGGDGYISLPLIGSVIAGGLSVPDLEFNIAYEYSGRYLQNPQISVYVNEFHSKRVAVLGEVNEPKLLEMTRNKSNLLEIVSLCGGITKDAGDLIYIIRPTEQHDTLNRIHYNNAHHYDVGTGVGDSAQGNWDEEDYLKIRDEVITVSVSELVKYQNPLSNVEILPGDMISIPPATFYFVFGEVDKPGAYQLKPRMTVLQALSQAGRFTDVARNKVKLIREDIESREKTIMSLNIKGLVKGDGGDIRIMGGDVFLVGKSTLKVVRKQLLTFGNAAITGFANAYAYQSVRD